MHCSMIRSVHQSCGFPISVNNSKVENNPFPDEILQMISCNCKKTSGSTDRCQCNKSNLLCTHLCSCFECSNQEILDEDFEDESSAEDKDSSDDAEITF